MNKLWTSIFLTAAAVLLLLFFSNDFGLIDIQETAIVVAIGIDTAEEGEGYDVTAQIAVPSSTGSGSAGNVTVKNAQTVGEAISELNHETGWYPTLVHCKLILLGEAVTETDVFRVLDYFLRNDAVEDSCLVAACAGTARETLQAQSPVNDISASAIAKVLSSEAQETGLVSVTILKDFAIGYYSVGKSGFLPYISVQGEAESQGGGGAAPTAEIDAAEECAWLPSLKRNRWWKPKRQPLPIAAPVSSESGSQGGADSGASGKSGSADVFQASETMLFYEGKQVAMLSPEETLAYNLAATDTDFAYGSVTAEQDGQETVYNLKMKIGKKKRSLTFENGMPVFTFTVRANARLADTDRASAILEVAKTQIADDAILRAAEKKFEQELSSAISKAAAAGCDLFGIKQRLYRYRYREYAAFQDSVLTAAQVHYDIRFTSLK